MRSSAQKYSSSLHKQYKTGFLQTLKNFKVSLKFIKEKGVFYEKLQGILD